MFAERLKIAREARGFSQASLAEILGTDQQQIWRWESNRVKPNSETVITIAHALNVSSDFLLGLSETMVGQSGSDDGLSPEERRALTYWRHGDKLEAIKVIAGG